MNQFTLLSAAFLGMTAIILGAFGAHALKKTLNEEQLKNFETGVKYQMHHALVLLILGFQLEFNQQIESYIVYCFISGIILFSFSIYGLVISSAKNKKMRFLGPITPLGGVLLTLGWGMLFYFFYVNS